MVKVTAMTDTDSNDNSFKVSLFADTKDEMTGITPADIIGIPDTATIEMGSVCLTADGDVAFMKSDGTWNWV